MGIGSGTSCLQVAIDCRQAADRIADVGTRRELALVARAHRVNANPVLKWRRALERGDRNPVQHLQICSG
jgi:hypothetical protein